MIQNKKGFSFIGFLIVLVIVMTLTAMLLKNYQKSLSTVTGKPTQQQSIQQLRNAVKDIEKTAAQRADLDPSVYR